MAGGRVAHAYLFVGSPGTGRAEMARALAAVVLCSERSADGTACDRCPSCRALDAGNHPDLHAAGVPEGRRLLPISTVREIQHVAALKPSMADAHAFVVRDAERMTLEAANCFLKTLEEPPGNAVFVLLAESLRDLPETVVSRCRVVRFRSLPADTVRARLQADGMAPADAAWAARRAWGSLGLARQIAGAGLADLNRRLLDALAALSPERNLRMSDGLLTLASEGTGNAAEAREKLQQLLECLLVAYRDAALVALGDTAHAVNEAGDEAVRTLAQGADADRLLQRADTVLETIERIDGNANRRLALDDMFTKLSREDRR